MASISKDSKGWRIRFFDPKGERKTLRLPAGMRVTKRQAEEIGRHVDALNVAACTQTPVERQTALWLADVGEVLHAKLAAAGLATPRTPAKAAEAPASAMTLEKFLAEFRNEGRTARGEQAAALTVIKWQAPMDKLLKFFGLDRPIDSITKEDAHQFRRWLDAYRSKSKDRNRKGRPLGENSKRKVIDNAKVFFNAAERRGLVPSNPFKFLPSNTRPNRERDFFVTRETTLRIIEFCPDAEWRLLVALWRFAGLRKMEVFNLTWGDILWEQGKMRVFATKTAHHEGRDIRYVPLRDLRELLEDLFELNCSEGTRPAPTDSLITRFIPTNSNLDKPLKAILHRAGITPWGKLFQNMRASCETEWLNEGHPPHVVAAIIGHSVKVQRDHYAQVTEGHFDRFNAFPPGGSGSLPDTTGTPTAKSGPPGGPVGARTGAKGGELGNMEVYPVSQKRKKTPKNGCFTGFPVAAEGFEPPTRGL